MPDVDPDSPEGPPAPPVDPPILAPAVKGDAEPAAGVPVQAGPLEDPNAISVATLMPPASPALAPEVEEHEPTGTTLLHYHGVGLDAPAVTAFARAAGYDVIGAPDQLAVDHWRIQVRTETKEA